MPAPDLFVGQGGDTLDAVFDRAIHLCSLAGAARGDRIIGPTSGGYDVKAAALDYLVEIDAIRPITPAGTDLTCHVYVLT